MPPDPPQRERGSVFPGPDAQAVVKRDKAIAERYRII
jgi:hypothetical protein